MELVTVKVLDTYFQVPEKLFSSTDLRIPREDSYISFELNWEGHSNSIVIVKYDPKNYNHQPLFDGLAAVSPQSVLNAEVISYLKSFTSTTPPETWDDDIALISKLGGYQSPCPGDDSKYEQKKRLIKAIEALTFEDLVKATDHRNSSVRVRAANLLGNQKFRNEKGLKQLLLEAQEDESYQVRMAALGSLGNVALHDSSVIPAIEKIKREDTSDKVRTRAATILKDLKEHPDKK